MKKRRFLVISVLCIVAASLALVLAILTPYRAHAEDLPIDITAIGRQDGSDSQVTTRIGANLFTGDAQRVNEALAEVIRIRQSAALYLFAEAQTTYEADPYTQLKNTAHDLALFAQPANFSNVTLPQPVQQLSLWVIAPVMAIAAIGGFVWAMVSKSKKKERQSVY